VYTEAKTRLDGLLFGLLDGGVDLGSDSIEYECSMYCACMIMI